MNLLDENIVERQHEFLREWGVIVRHIGHDIVRQGVKDEEIIPFLHALRYTTFFTLDLDFYNRQLCHTNYSLVFMNVASREAAMYIRRVLRHPALNTQAKRMGTVIRAELSGLSIWRLHAEQEDRVPWPQ